MKKRQDDVANAEKPKKEFEEVMLEVRRVTRVTTGGRQLSFRATILVGNRKGKIGVGVAKGSDVAIAVKKATTEAHKNIVDVPITDSFSIPYAVTSCYKSAEVKLIPASAGTGLKAGSSVRVTLDIAGYSNILSKIVGTNNKLNNVLATIQALSSFKKSKIAFRKSSSIEETQESDSLNIENPQKAIEHQETQDIVDEVIPQMGEQLSQSEEIEISEETKTQND